MLKLLPFRNLTPANPDIDEYTKLASIELSPHDDAETAVVGPSVDLGIGDGDAVLIVDGEIVITVDKEDVTIQLSVMAMLATPPAEPAERPLQISCAPKAM